MDKAKTLEVLRGMKFMQRKEEAKRRATFEVAQREEIERQLYADGSGSKTAAAASSWRNGPARATVLYDDAFPRSLYGLTRRTFADTLGGPSAAVDSTAENGAEKVSGAAEEVDSSDPHAPPFAAKHSVENKSVNESDDDALNSGEESVADLWEDEDKDDDGDCVEATEVDPTAAPGHRASHKKSTAKQQQQQQRSMKTSDSGRSDGRFTVQSAVRAPKLPRRLKEAVIEEERQRKRRRTEDNDGMDF